MNMKLRPILGLATASVLLVGGGLWMNRDNFHPTAALAQAKIAQTNDSTPASDPAVEPSVAPSDAPLDGPKGSKGRREDALFTQLNLTTEQKQQIQSIRDQQKSSSQELRQDMKTAADKMRSLMASNTSTADTLRQQHRQMQDLMQKIGDQRFETLLKIREVLTPDQRVKAADLLQKHRGGGGGHHRGFSPEDSSEGDGIM